MTSFRTARIVIILQTLFTFGILLSIAGIISAATGLYILYADIIFVAAHLLYRQYDRRAQKTIGQFRSTSSSFRTLAMLHGTASIFAILLGLYYFFSFPKFPQERFHVATLWIIALGSGVAIYKEKYIK